MTHPTRIRTTAGRYMVLGVFLAVLPTAMLLVVTPARAATTFAVDRTDDPDPAGAKACTDAPNDCSLRGAIVAANAATGADAVTVPAGTHTLTRAGADDDAASTGDLDVTGEVTITGAGARSTSVAGGPAPFDDRIFQNHSGAKTTISGLTITGGKLAGNASGGGVHNQGGLTLDGVSVKGNSASGDGGGILSEGTLNLTDSTVSGNTSAKDVGGVYQNAGGIANITNSTISSNKAARFGGGVLAAGARINLRNSTIVSNEGGGLGGNVMSAIGASVVLKNTIVSGNPLENCNTEQFDGFIFSQGNNISSDDSCGFTETGDKQNTNPRLGPLADNGGPTDTRALLAGSPAVDAGSNTGCPAADQRGVARPQRGTCDIGAFERANSTPVANNDSYAAREDATLTRSAPGVLANDADPDGDALRASVVSGPSKGTLTLNPNGSFTFKPKPNLSGTDSFSYRVSDGKGGTDTATVTINIAPVNDAPTVTPISPAPGASTSDRTPLIRAKARDIETNLSRANIKLFVDGKAVSAARFSYDASTDVLSHTPSAALTIGGHAVRVVATDAQGRSTTRQWGFRVN